MEVDEWRVGVECRKIVCYGEWVRQRQEVRVEKHRMRVEKHMMRVEWSRGVLSPHFCYKISFVRIVELISPLPVDTGYGRNHVNYSFLVCD
ncbi:hypothetical protein U1Q18_004510 [Sarracenia purpurea var. burkii]